MNQSILAPVSGLQEVTSTEALQGGAPPIRRLDGEVKKKVSRFVEAHIDSTSPLDDSMQAEVIPKEDSTQQVSASEQQTAFLGRGFAVPFDKKRTQQKSKFIQLYKVLFTPDEKFFAKDLAVMLNSLRSKGKSLVDYSSNLNEPEKALRKYLLLRALETNSMFELNQSDQTELALAKKTLENLHGEFILGTLGAYDVGRAQAFKGPTLKEFIKAYQVLEIHPVSNEPSNDIHALYKLIKKDLENGTARKKLVQMQEGFIQVLCREKTQEPKRITSPRHHLLLSRIRQFGFLINLHALHDQFLSWAQKAEMQGLPSITQLTETCLQAVLTNETLAGANALVAIAAAVSSDKVPARNSFIANYCRRVLLNDLLKGMHKSNHQRKVLVENIERNTQLSAILAPSR